MIYIFDEDRSVWVLYNSRIIDYDFWESFDSSDFVECDDNV